MPPSIDLNFEAHVWCHMESYANLPMSNESQPTCCSLHSETLLEWATVILDQWPYRIRTSGVRVVDVHLEKDLLTIEADVPTDQDSHIQVQSEWPKYSSQHAVALGFKYIELPKIRAVESPVSGKKPVTLYQCMGANKEIGSRSIARTTVDSVFFPSQSSTNI